MDLKKEIIKTSNAVRKKYLALKRGVADEEQIFQKKFKPIVDPINEIVKTISNPKDHSKREKLSSISNAVGKEKKIDVVKSNANRRKSKHIVSKPITEGEELENEPEEDDSKEGEGTVNSDEDDSITDDDSDEGEVASAFESYLRKCTSDTNNDMDHTYGVYHGGSGQWMIGDSKILFNRENNTVEINSNEFKLTKGLLELMFKKNPTKNFITTSDLEDYKNILILTNAHLVRYKEGERINGTKSPKYQNYISKLFKKGYGLETDYMKLQSAPCAPEFVHYDNINKVVDRLRKLKASEAAGNNSHNNEVVNIIAELKDRGVIE